MNALALFEWDEQKAARNLAVHGISFTRAPAVFHDPDNVILDTTRVEDGETRSKVVGRLGSHLVTVVFTMRGEVCRIISVRRTNAPERRAYDGHR